MRTFIAIELPTEIKNSLAGLQEELKKCGIDAKWVQPQNIHLTLKFLGKRDAKLTENVTRVLSDVAFGKKTFQINITSLGAFPKITSPRVIWVGIEEGDRQTREIAQELEEKIARLGIPKEDRPFSSHITIARIRSGLNRDKLISSLNSLQDKFKSAPLSFTARKITLFKSTLKPSGPVYEVLKEAGLK